MPLKTIEKRSDFLAANNTPKRFITNSFILQMNKRNDQHPAGPEARYGYTVTKKMGNAVIRNRIKRRLREAARAVAPRFAVEGHDYVLISRHKALECSFADLLRDMEFAFSKIPVMKDNPRRR